MMMNLDQLFTTVYHNHIVGIFSCSNHAEDIKFTREKPGINNMLVVANKVK